MNYLDEKILYMHTNSKQHLFLDFSPVNLLSKFKHRDKYYQREKYSQHFRKKVVAYFTTDITVLDHIWDDFPDKKYNKTASYQVENPS